ncbi:MAG: chitobiase/beta-hexosaminidase C-terminal domain-containing protein, partial [Lachnospiraceae bacterium]|nr:chitobiase/beta-hexosaminidase C-terminal domain-containing protein [Lachnospiraceae bacterium]
NLTYDATTDKWTWTVHVPLGTNTTPVNGTYRYQFALTDSVGHEVSSKSYESKVDTIAPVVTITTPANETAKRQKNAINENNFKFVGTLNEANEVHAVWYKIVEDGGSAPTVTLPGEEEEVSGQAALEDSSWTGWTKATSGITSWNAIQAFKKKGTSGDGIEEGLGYTIYVRAVDNAGNVSTNVSQVFDVDMEEPVVAINSLDPRTKQGFTLSGTASDSLALLDSGADAITIKDGSQTWNVTVNSNGTWSKAFRVTGETGEEPLLADGSHTFEVEAQDSATKKNTERKTATILIDTTAPVVTVTDFRGTNTNGVRGYTNESSKTFSGTVEEANLSSLTAQLYRTGTAAAVDSKSLTPDSEGAWTWNVYNINTDGEYTLKVTAVDAVENTVTVDTSTAAAPNYILVKDSTLPVSTLRIDSGNLYNNQGTAVTSIADGGTYYAKDAFAIGGVIEETNYDSTTVKVKVNNGSAQTPTLSGTDNKTWSFSVPDTTADGSYTYTLLITDRAQNQKTYNVTVIYDKSVGNITMNAVSAVVSATPLAISGSTDDAGGIGIAHVYYTTDGSDPATSSTKVEATLAEDGTWTADAALGTTQGNRVIKYIEVDKLGNKTTTAGERTFLFDTAAPTITETSILNDTGKVNNIVTKRVGFTLSGTASDTYQLYGNPAGTGAVTITLGSQSWTVDVSSGNWSKSFVVGEENENEENYVEDGLSQVFTVTVKDSANKTTSLTRTVNVDTTTPTGAISEKPSNANTKTLSYTFSGTASDGDGIGIDKVYLKIEDEADSTNSNEVEVTGKDNWSTVVTFASFGGNVFQDEGWKKLTIRVLDKAGNEYTLGTGANHRFNYDKADPELNVTESTYQQYMNGSGYILYGTATDSNHLVTGATDDLAITDTQHPENNNYPALIIRETLNGSETTSSGQAIAVPANGEWTVHLPLNAANPSDGTYKYILTLKDVVGNVVNSTEYTSIVDTTAPTVAISKPLTTETGTTAIKDSTYSLEGTFAEANAIDAVWYKILQSTAAVPAAAVTTNGTAALSHSTWTTAGWTAAQAGTIIEGTGNWSFYQSFKEGNAADDVAGLPEGKYKIHLYAVDKAGNISAIQSREFHVDFTNPTLTETSASEFQTRDGFTLTGTVSDTNQLTSLVITDSNTNNPVRTWTATPESPESDTSWSQAFVVGSGSSGDNKLVDGEHVLTITATDVQGKTTVLTRTVTVDTTAPAITINTPANNERTGLSSINETSFKIDGSITEANAVQAVYFKVLSATATAPQALASGSTALTEANWTSESAGWRKATSGNTLWSSTQAFTSGATSSTAIGEGNQKLYVVAVDRVGNVSSVINSAFTVDMTEPSISASINATNNANCKFENETYYFKNTISGSISWSDSYGMDADNPVTVKIGNVDKTNVTAIGNPDENGIRTWSIPASAFTSGVTQALVFTAKDKVGRIGRTIPETFNVYYDSTGPVIGITNPNEGESKTDSSFEASGTISEAGIGLDKLQYTTAATPAETDWHDITVASGSTLWTQTLSFNSEGAEILRVRAWDKLGNNATTVIRNFYYDSH